MRFLRPILVALTFWILVCIAFLSGCAHRPECLCPTCEAQYAAEWEADQAELDQR